jgi:trehalose/maltose transport system permease protein
MRLMLRPLLFWTGIALILGWSLFPLWYAVVTSLSTDTQMFVPHYWPPQLYWGNYADLLQRSSLLRGMVNSAVVGAGALALSLGLALLAAYPLARVFFPGRHLVLFAVLATTMFPQVAVLAGFYELIRALGLYNRLAGVVLADLVLMLPFSLWLLTTYMRALPREIEDIAILDGAPPLTILLKVLLPLMWPGVVTTGLLSFIAIWNEFLFAFTFTLTEDTRTAPVALSLLGGMTPHDVPWGDLMAACVILSLPMAGLVLVFQRRIVSGLTAGAIGG